MSRVGGRRGDFRRRSPLFSFLVGLNGLGGLEWTESASGTAEFYISLAEGADPGLDEPGAVYAGDAPLISGTVGSLSAGEWDYGDNDTLGFDTIYVRLEDDADPDSKPAGFVRRS